MGSFIRPGSELRTLLRCCHLGQMRDVSGGAPLIRSRTNCHILLILFLRKLHWQHSYRYVDSCYDSDEKALEGEA